MLFKMLLATVAVLLLRSHGVSASEAVYRSFGQVRPCPNAHPANVTSFDMSIDPNNLVWTFGFSGLATVPGNATLSIAMWADGNEMYLAQIDPCSYGIPDLCPATGGVASFANASVEIPERLLDRLRLSSRADVRGRLSMQIYDAYARFHSFCVETKMRSDGSGDGNGTTTVGGTAEGSGSGNETNGSEGNNSVSGTIDNGGNDTNGTAQDSGANTLQGVGFVAM